MKRLGANVNVKIVSEMLGHSQTAFTMDRYQHGGLAMQREAALGDRSGS